MLSPSLFYACYFLYLLRSCLSFASLTVGSWALDTSSVAMVEAFPIYMCRLSSAKDGCTPIYWRKHPCSRVPKSLIPTFIPI
ncbi:hypothetical protein BJY04DRAFT_22900 [Aspergillus karnatakaensis]|uniref:uncharacterized protein n=1 Tax=Aspergillus karnatakaensis TaxID=1810916 RepID=UPI003CCD017D